MRQIFSHEIEESLFILFVQEDLSLPIKVYCPKRHIAPLKELLIKFNLVSYQPV